ncbi:MAG: hypothetical protein KIS72_00825 [Luteimonas sp.]|nr:hypothetical protein [Luteimonas sp.]
MSTRTGFSVSGSALAAMLAVLSGVTWAEDAGTAAAADGYDAALAARLAADERGMRRYVLVVLRTGAARVPDGPARDAMFAGHFANMERMAKAGKLAIAGPFQQDPAGWRGLYVFAVESIDEARELAETDPVVVQGEMVAEYHEWYGSAALMLVPETHGRIVPPARP